MLVVYVPDRQCLARLEIGAPETVPAQAVWIDLLNPSRDEELKVETALGIDVPTREEMQEIEVSNRFYVENDAVYMTATVISRLDSEIPLSSPVTFVLSGEKLITIRYAEPRPFRNFTMRAQRTSSGYISGPLVMFGLLEALINRIADIVEQVGIDIDTISRDVFDADASQNRRDFQDILRRLGRSGDLSSKTRESLVSIARVIHFLLEAVDLSHLPYGRDINNRMKALDKDIISLLDHVTYVATKINFLLDATLGLINIEQNNIIKFFTIVTVLLMPPMLIAGIYGMNFKFMPELNWNWGYLFSLLLMVVSAIVPVVFFRRRGWF